MGQQKNGKMEDWMIRDKNMRKLRNGKTSENRKTKKLGTEIMEDRRQETGDSITVENRRIRE